MVKGFVDSKMSCIISNIKSISNPRMYDLHNSQLVLFLLYLGLQLKAGNSDNLNSHQGNTKIKFYITEILSFG